jgi:hypothetical protein
VRSKDHVAKLTQSKMRLATVAGSGVQISNRNRRRCLVGNLLQTPDKTEVPGAAFAS